MAALRVSELSSERLEIINKVFAVDHGKVTGMGSEMRTGKRKDASEPLPGS